MKCCNRKHFSAGPCVNGLCPSSYICAQGRCLPASIVCEQKLVYNTRNHSQIFLLLQNVVAEFFFIDSEPCELNLSFFSGSMREWYLPGWLHLSEQYVLRFEFCRLEFNLLLMLTVFQNFFFTKALFLSKSKFISFLAGICVNGRCPTGFNCANSTQLCMKSSKTTFSLLY